MSLTSLHDGVLQSKRAELAKCVAARNRKLGELLTVAISYPDFPLRPPSPITLSTFLEQNDIERGRLFDEATLPLRSQNVTLGTDAESATSTAYAPKATTPSLSSDVSNAQPSEALAITPTGPVQEIAPSDSSLIDRELKDMGGRRHDQVSNGSQTILATTERLLKFGIASPAALQTPLTPLPPDAPEDVREIYREVSDPSRVLAQIAAAKLESPPGSPGVNPQDAIPMTLEDRGSGPEVGNLNRDNVTVEVIEEAVSELSKPSQLTEQPSGNQSEEQSLSQEQTDHSLSNVQAQGMPAEESSPSSTVGPHSTSTSQVNAASPATTAEEAPTPTDTHASGRKRPLPASFSPEQESTTEVLGSVSAFKRRKISEGDVHTPDAQLRLENEQAQQAQQALLRDHPSAAPLTSQEDDVEAGPQTAIPTAKIGVQDSLRGDHDQPTAEATTITNDDNGFDSSDKVEDKAQAAKPDASMAGQASQVELELTERPNHLDLTKGAASHNDNDLPTTVTPLRSNVSAQANQSAETLTSHISGTGQSKFVPMTSAVRQAVTEPTRTGHHRVRNKPLSMGFGHAPSQQNKAKASWSYEEYEALRGCADKQPQDYLRTLYSFEAYQKPRATSLRDLVANRVKVISTSNHLTALNEEQDYRILKRIKELQEAKSWSCLQMERGSEPVVPTTHLDTLLAEVRWLALDFREERKWKLAVAKGIAQACADWVASTPDERTSMQVRIRASTRHSQTDNETQDQNVQAEIPHATQSSPTPDLVASAGSDSPSDELAEDAMKLPMLSMLPPAALFALGPADCSFPLQPSTFGLKMLEELPLYDPTQGNDDDQHVPIVPVSKYVLGKIVAAPSRRRRKTSRYDYEDDSDGPDHLAKRIRLEDQSSSPQQLKPEQAILPPERDDVALFDPANLHQRQRLWAAHSFRPPPAQEYPMPSQKFYESRWPSQWTQEDDDKLRALVREYSYNWPLISDCMAPKTLYPPATERRTPWECFERWVRLEGLPPDMAKHSYFKTWQARVEAGRRMNITRQQAAEQQQQGAPSQAMLQAMSVRVRPDGSTESFKVMKRRNTKHINFLSFFKRIAQRDETLKYKKEETRKAAAARKAQEVTQPRSNLYSPQAWSKMKHDREKRVMERQQAYHEQAMAQRRAMMMQRSAQQTGQASIVPNGVGQQQTHTGSALPNGQVSMSNGLLQPGSNPQARSHNMPPPMQINPSNSGLPMNTAAVSGIPQAQMQPNMRGGQGFPSQISPENVRLLQARQAQMQRAYQAQQQLANQQNSSQAVHASMQQAVNHHGGMYNPAQLAAMQAATNGNGISTPPVNNGGRPSASSSSPRNGHVYPLPNGHPQPLSSGHVPVISHISHQIQAQQPHLSPDQVKQLSSEQLKQKLTEQQRQNALNAVAGSFAANNAAYQANGIDQSKVDPAQQQQQREAYRQQMQQHMMRQQQQQQRMQNQPGNNGFNGHRPPSQGATPQHPQHQRTGSGPQSLSQSGTPPQRPISRGPNQSQSPRIPQAQSGVTRQA